jgi:hypothetical protein
MILLVVHFAYQNAVEVSESKQDPATFKRDWKVA